MKPVILSALDERHRIYVPKAPQRLALALTKYAASIFKDFTICAYDTLRGIALSILNKEAIKGCKECNNESNYALLWCPGKCTERLILAAGTIIKNYRSCGLEKIDVKKVSRDTYLLLIHLDNAILREYITVDSNYEIKKSPSPCKDVAAFEILEKHFGIGEILLKEAIEALSIELGVSKTKAREIIASLSEKGCIDIDIRNKKILVYEP